MKFILVTCFIIFFTPTASFAKNDQLDEIKITKERVVTSSHTDSKRITIEDIHTDKECLFAGTHRYYKLKEAKNDARRNYYDRSYYIYTVGNGLGPEVPVPDDFYNLVCKGITIERKILWIGSDSLACKNHSKMERKALNYAKKFNHEMITALKENELCL